MLMPKTSGAGPLKAIKASLKAATKLADAVGNLAFGGTDFWGGVELARIVLA